MHVCHESHAWLLDNWVRRIIHPGRILAPFVRKGMTVLDMGCGPGHFSRAMAAMGANVIAADLQEGMLARTKASVKGTPLEKNITFHRTGERSIGLRKKVDFILAFYMVHELPDQTKFFREARSLFKKNATLLVVEPRLHVSKRAFAETIAAAEAEGLRAIETPRIFLSRAVLLRRSGTRRRNTAAKV